MYSTGISIYTIVVIFTVAGPVSFFLKSQPELLFGIQAAGIIFSTTVMICLVFLPKVNSSVTFLRKLFYIIVLHEVGTNDRQPFNAAIFCSQSLARFSGL